MASLTLLSRFTGKDVELEENSAEYYDQCPCTMIENSLKAKLGFLRKVYILIFMQLFACVIVGFVMMFSPKIRFYIHNNDWLMSLSIILTVSIMIALHCKR